MMPSFLNMYSLEVLIKPEIHYFDRTHDFHPVLFEHYHGT